VRKHFTGNKQEKGNQDGPGGGGFAGRTGSMGFRKGGSLISTGTSL